MIKILALNESVPLSIDLKVVYVKTPPMDSLFSRKQCFGKFR